MTIALANAATVVVLALLWSKRGLLNASIKLTLFFTGAYGALVALGVL